MEECLVLFKAAFTVEMPAGPYERQPSDRQAYSDHLQAVRDHSAWDDWLALFLRSVEEVSHIALFREDEASEAG